jgi:hypothetical protein
MVYRMFSFFQSKNGYIIQHNGTNENTHFYVRMQFTFNYANISTLRFIASSNVRRSEILKNHIIA